MRNVLLFFLLATCLSLSGRVMAQDEGIQAQGKGWVLTKDSCLTITKDYDGDMMAAVIDEYDSEIWMKRLIIEEGVTSTENFKWASRSYQYCNWLSSITLPRSMTSLVIMREYYDELECWGRSYSYFAADTVICLSEVPPSVDNGVFLRGHGILQVPKGCIEAYRSSDWAIYFDAIVDRPDTTVVMQPYGRGWEIKDDSVLVINKDYVWPPTGNDYYQQYVWHYPDDKINTVVLEDGVTYVGDGFCTCFRGYVNLPSTIEKWGSGVFFEANVLGDLVLYDGECLGFIRSIEGDLIMAGGEFNGLGGVYSLGGDLILRDGLKAIGDDAFSYSRWGDKPIPALPPSVERIGARAFKGQKDLWSFTVPPSVIEIGDEAFAGTRLNSIDLPPSLQKVGAGVFADREECAIWVRCYAVEPPELKSTYNFLSCTDPEGGWTILDVPEESYDKYEASPWWDLFATFGTNSLPYEYNYTSLKEADREAVRVSVKGGVVSVSGGEPFEVYDLAGRKMPSGRPLPAGVYVVSTSAGSRKVVVR